MPNMFFFHCLLVFIGEKIFHLYRDGQHYDGKKLISTQRVATTLHRLMQFLPSYVVYTG